MSPTSPVAQARSSRRWPALAVLAAVLLFTVAPALPAASASYQHGTVAGKIDRFLTTQLKQSAIPGAAVAVTRGDRVLLVRGYGHDSTQGPVTGDSLFRIASLSKSFTALAVMQSWPGRSSPPQARCSRGPGRGGAYPAPTRPATP